MSNSVKFAVLYIQHALESIVLGCCFMVIPFFSVGLDLVGIIEYDGKKGVQGNPKYTKLSFIGNLDELV